MVWLLCRWKASYLTYNMTNWLIHRIYIIKYNLLLLLFFFLSIFMYILSILNDWKDIISQCLDDITHQQIVQLKKDDIGQKCIDKIMATIQYFFVNNLTPDGWYIKTLENNIIEFRIILPKSKYLLRVIAWYKNWSALLLTWYLIKPYDYNDSYTTSTIDKEYSSQIQKAKTIRQDYTWAQQYDYVVIKNHL